MKTYITFGQDLQFFQPSFAGKKVKRNLRPRKNTETYVSFKVIFWQF